MQAGFESPPPTMNEILAERVRTNRMLVRASIARMEEARAAARTRRSESTRLRLDIRHQLDLIREGMVEAHRWKPVQRTVVGRTTSRFGSRQPDPLDATRQELHAAYAATKDPLIRAELLASYDGFARSLAFKFRHRESMDDLLQVARIGLLHAIDRFNPELGRPFPLFARVTITGELKRHIRDRTWGMRVARSLQEDYLNVMRAVDELTAEQSDSPSMEAVAARCGMSVERVLEALELRASQRTLSIDAPTSPESDEPVIEISQDDLGFARLENRELLAHLLGRLPERDRRIVELRFMEELTQSEIAEQIGVSQMCVSRVLARTLGRLRGWARTAVA